MGLHQTVSHPGARLSWEVAGLLSGGSALYLATFSYTRWRMRGQISVRRLTAAAAMLLILPIARLMPALGAVCAVAAVLGALSLFEDRRNAAT